MEYQSYLLDPTVTQTLTIPSCTFKSLERLPWSMRPAISRRCSRKWKGTWYEDSYSSLVFPIIMIIPKLWIIYSSSWLTTVHQFITVHHAFCVVTTPMWRKKYGSYTILRGKKKTRCLVNLPLDRPDEWGWMWSGYGSNSLAIQSMVFMPKCSSFHSYINISGWWF